MALAEADAAHDPAGTSVAGTMLRGGHCAV